MPPDGKMESFSLLIPGDKNLKEEILTKLNQIELILDRHCPVYGKETNIGTALVAVLGFFLGHYSLEDQINDSQTDNSEKGIHFCAICDCENSSLDQPLYAFPSNSKLLREWKDYVTRKGSFYDPNRMNFLCAKHFHSSSFELVNKKTLVSCLKKNAVPCDVHEKSSTSSYLEKNAEENAEKEDATIPMAPTTSMESVTNKNYHVGCFPLISESQSSIQLFEESSMLQNDFSYDEVAKNCQTSSMTTGRLGNRTTTNAVIPNIKVEYEEEDFTACDESTTFTHEKDHENEWRDLKLMINKEKQVESYKIEYEEDSETDNYFESESEEEKLDFKDKEYFASSDEEIHGDNRIGCNGKNEPLKSKNSARKRILGKEKAIKVNKDHSQHIRRKCHEARLKRQHEKLLEKYLEAASIKGQTNSSLGAELQSNLQVQGGDVVEKVDNGETGEEDKIGNKLTFKEIDAIEPGQQTFYCEICDKTVDMRRKYRDHMMVQEHQRRKKRLEEEVGKDLADKIEKAPMRKRLDRARMMEEGTEFSRMNYNLSPDLARIVLYNLRRFDEPQVKEGTASSNDRPRCPICFTSHFYLKHSYLRHVEKHFDEKFCCNYCLKMTVTEEEMLAHHKKCHPGGRRTCNSLVDKKQMVVCEHCGKSLPRGRISTHKRNVHRKERKACTWEGCTKKFTTGYNLRMHMQIHLGEKKLQCELCGYRCIQRNSMHWHMKSKHNIVTIKSKDKKKKK